VSRSSACPSSLGFGFDIVISLIEKIVAKDEAMHQSPRVAAHFLFDDCIRNADQAST
jgi:hypothetical protein